MFLGCGRLAGGLGRFKNNYKEPQNASRVGAHGATAVTVAGSTGSPLFLQLTTIERHEEVMISNSGHCFWKGEDHEELAEVTVIAQKTLKRQT